jgi:hypothetical protein
VAKGSRRPPGLARACQEEAREWRQPYGGSGGFYLAVEGRSLGEVAPCQSKS